MAGTEEDSPKGETDPSSSKEETSLDGIPDTETHSDNGSKNLGESDISSNDENKSRTADEMADSNLALPSSTNSVDSVTHDELSTEGADADASADASPSANSAVNDSGYGAGGDGEIDKVPKLVKDDEGSKSSLGLPPTLVSHSEFVDKDKDGDSDSDQDSKRTSGDQSEAKELPDTTEQALFSDDEDSIYLSPENKLVEVILQEGDDESGTNLDAFIPEVQCSVEELEDTGSADGDNVLEKGCDLGLVIGGVVSTFNEADGLMAGAEGIIMNAEGDVSLNDDENSALDNDGVSQPGPSDPEDVQRTYIADFYSDASNIGPETEVSGNEEGKKGLSLYRFPKIVKNLASVEYSLLQELYKLIYARNPWDTMEILSQRILDFSGFNFSQDSEEYFNRHLTLESMPLNTLKSVAALLCLDCSKGRLNLESNIMGFLHRPSRQAVSRQKTNRSVPARTKSSHGSGNKRRSRKRKSTQSRSEQRSKSSKLSVSRLKSGRSLKSDEEEIEIIEDSLEKEDENSNTETEPDIKMKLKRTSKQSFCLVPADETPASENKDKSDLDEEENPESSDASEKNTGGKQKLQDFPEILSNIEGTPDKILKEIHYLLFLEDCDLDVLKENIMQFSGFSSDSGSKEYEQRKKFLEKMQNSVIKNLVDTFYLTNQSDKDENIDVILEFLKSPDRDLMKKAAEAPDQLLLNSKMNVEGLSDSDDSISFEIVTKKVDCIDLISSGDDDEEEEKPVKTEAKTEPIPPQPVEDDAPKKRTLRNFETITKIVNTHPNEYLVDIYNLLYMLPSDPTTIRKEILDFSGFEFEKGTPEYVRRKQFLDRMQYNSVRRIFNTLIHNTREVRVFSKPTMITDVFQFLFKLPDTDTSIRQPLPKPNPLPSTSSQGLSMASLALLKSANNNSPGLAAVNAILSQSNAKLSELKRVFQRVACFPCEYLIDVHKLLFMKDCEMTEIRQRIFSFKGFPFGVNSSEFKQRKMYLEYLTFHSLRKISSVLTTKNVDLRNSTKHELASHLTKVLMEYTDMKPSDIDFDPKEAIQVESNQKSAADKVAAAKDSNVEKIVVMPVIESYTGSPENTSVSSAPKIIHLQSEQQSQPTFERIITPSVLHNQAKVQSEVKLQSPKVNRRKKCTPPAAGRSTPVMSGVDPTSTMQFQDIHLPEVEKLVRNFQPGPPQLRDLRPKNMMNNPATTNFIDVVRCNYQSMIDQHNRQVPPPYPVAISMPRPTHPVPFQIVPPFQAQTSVSNLYFPSAPSMIRPMEMFTKDDEMGGCSETVPVECILTEEPDSGEPAAKKPFLAQLLSGSKPTPIAVTSRGSTNSLQSIPSKQPAKSSSVMTSQEESLHMKIRDAMTKGSEDEEDCDKPLATLVGHPNDKVLKQQICGIVENTNLQDITINGVIQKIFNMYPKYNLNYRKEFIKSTLRSLLYRLGEEDSLKTGSSAKSPDSSVSTTDPSDSFSEAAPSSSVTPPVASPGSTEAWNKTNSISTLKKQKS